MGNIIIKGDDNYAIIAVKCIVQKIMTGNTQNNNYQSPIAVFIFSKTWVSVSELLSLTCCKAGKILIIGNAQLLTFLSLKIDNRKISYCEINRNLAEIELKLSQFLLKKRTTMRLSTIKTPFESPKQLNWKEFMIISLYISGNSIRDIAGVMHLDYKTVYNYKSQAMRKMGLSDKLSLVRHWCHYH